LVEDYVFRRAICGIPTNSLNKTFANLYKSVDNENYVESIAASFQLMDVYQRYPNDSEFENEIRAKDIYNLRARNYLLGKLENFGRRDFVNIDEYTIEHILPQNPNLSAGWQEMLGETWKQVQENYLHTLGNLTLTGYNSELSDRPFQEKKTISGGFNVSPIRLNDHLREIDTWNESAILERSYKLAQLAKQVWKAPNLPEDRLNLYRKTEPVATTTYSLEDYKHLEGEMLELYQHLRRRIINLGPSVKEEYTKLYIAFRSAANFVELVPQKSKLKLYLNIDFVELIDPNGLGRDVSGIGSWGSGDVEVSIAKESQLDQIMDLVQQAYDKQTEGI
jgi:predicted transport protein